MKTTYAGNISPCLLCTRVKDPQNCENKNCQVWRRWFLARWERLRTLSRQAMEQRPLERAGVCIGGQRYPHPDRVRDYLATDPCRQCLTAALCAGPCGLRKAWEAAKGGGEE